MSGVIRKSVMAVVALGFAFSMVGCVGYTGGLKKENAQLKSQSQSLSASVEALKAENDALAQQNAALSGDLSRTRAESVAKSDELDAMTQKLTSEGFDVQMRDGMMVVTLPTKILFASGSAALASSGTTKLKQLSATLNGELKGYPVEVQGHTDTDPINRTKDRYRSNWELSYERAQTVANSLMKSGVEPKRVHVSAYGQYHPMASNTTADGKAKNRRVEVVVMRPGTPSSSSVTSSPSAAATVPMEAEY